MKTCSVKGCNNKYHGKGYCLKHYHQIRNHGKIIPDKIKYIKCSIKGCNQKVRTTYAKYCEKHYTQMYRHGKILNNTIYDKNEYRFSEYYCAIWLYNKEGEKIKYTIIDKEDFDLVKDYKWGYVHMGYARGSNGENNRVLLHQLLLNTKYIDHINRNGLDNRKCNLRKATISQNACNSKIRLDNTSGYKGVSWSKASNKWQAYIVKNKKMIYLGLFDSKKQAAHAYNKSALEHFGKFARLNNL